MKPLIGLMVALVMCVALQMVNAVHDDDQRPANTSQGTCDTLRLLSMACMTLSALVLQKDPNGTRTKTLIW